jgi:hypothetical protein
MEMNPYIVFYTFPARGWIGWNHWNPPSGAVFQTEEYTEAAFKDWCKWVFADTQGMHYMVCHRTREKGL